MLNDYTRTQASFHEHKMALSIQRIYIRLTIITDHKMKTSYHHIWYPIYIIVHILQMNKMLFLF